jgi:probable H4MPT-linked C1 transfer pathway protein
MSTVLGWDIGGAHLKLALARDGTVVAVRQVPTPLWLGLDRLAAALDEALSPWPAAEQHAVTMTAELADLFPDRASGVRGILETLMRRLPAKRIAVYAGDGAFLPPDVAAADPERVASANWHAAAALAARQLGDGLLADVGSTTSDLVPLRGGRVVARGRDDYERLARNELVYRGVVRTPVMALAPDVRLDGARVGLMAEFFATTADVFRLTGALPPEADQQPTADGRGKTPAESRARLARMVGRDAASAPDGVWDRLARQLAARLLRDLAGAARRVIARTALPATAPIIGAGVGRFLAATLARRLGRPYLSYACVIPAAAGVAEPAADCAPAAAMALLAAPSSAVRSRATAAASSGAARPPLVSAERKPRKSGASGSKSGRSAAASEPARPASSRRSRASARKRARRSGGR